MSVYECYLPGSTLIEADSEDEAKKEFIEFLKWNVSKNMVEVEEYVDDGIDDLDKYNQRQEGL